jgi:hypothetical protein
MKSINIRIRLLFPLLICLFMISGLLSCQKTGKVMVQVDSSTGFPTLIITNPFGDDVTLQPVSESVGSIGFVIDGEVIWLK